ncbi:beta-ketoacyl-[acyl-carrier-protein] synthase family protein [Dyella amyloliquefaciens]|uniref:beta-ketoacyl-[acyl-carrier-protein] synthase family protein n=1 Tax=Dyella amyloliquefaciens TaxID=1770545 RepID=UPI00102E2AAC|nr:beta-ketoacyl synthase N-terminal-like domain-containing protein [Dyella amyloliquefaciens]
MNAVAAPRASLPRVVVTGMGAVSCVGVGTEPLLGALRSGRSGVRHLPQLEALGMRCQVGGAVEQRLLEEPPRKLRRFLPVTAWYAWQAAREAIAQSGLTPGQLASPTCGLVIGGGAALSEHQAALESFASRGIARLSPYIVTRGMSSSVSAGLAHAFGVGGRSMVITSACTSGAHAIGQALELIQLGKLQKVICGGSEELHDTTALWFDAMGALSVNSNAQPERASRPYDAERDGIVLAAGAGVLVLESLEHARARGATILAEVCGYGASTDATSMVGPGPAGIADAMRQALDEGGTLPDYINTHACSTPLGDLAEWEAIETVFRERGTDAPALSSIKGLIGHAPAAAGALDAIACLLMMQHGFAAGTDIVSPDAMFEATPLLTSTTKRQIDCALSNSFGFGGSCASLMFRRMTGDHA